MVTLQKGRIWVDFEMFNFGRFQDHKTYLDWSLEWMEIRPCSWRYKNVGTVYEKQLQLGMVIVSVVEIHS